MHRRFLLVLPFCLLGARVSRAAEFVEGTEDLPLMPGLKPIRGSSLVFDKPEGRIVEAQAQGAQSRVEVRRFYADSLPQLGWKKTGADQWQRDAEHLKLDFRGQDGHLTVGFTLSPQ
jgi:hypothetical protein